MNRDENSMTLGLAYEESYTEEERPFERDTSLVDGRGLFSVSGRCHKHGTYDCLACSLECIGSTSFVPPKPLPLDEKIRDFLHKVEQTDEVPASEAVGLLRECLGVLEAHTDAVEQMVDKVAEAKRKVESHMYQGEQA